jgi:hypothetical protein
MFSGTSHTTERPIAAMRAGAAALCCGAELGSQCLLPPTPSIEAMVRRAYEAGRTTQETAAKTIEKIAVDWDGQLPAALVPDDDARDLARTYPVLFPLSWLCDRLLSSKGAQGWASEFELMTDIPAKHACTPADWATQAFRERAAHRLHAEYD